MNQPEEASGLKTGTLLSHAITNLSEAMDSATDPRVRKNVANACTIVHWALYLQVKLNAGALPDTQSGQRPSQRID